VKFHRIISEERDYTIWIQYIYCQLLLSNFFFSQFIDTQFVGRRHETLETWKPFCYNRLLANKIDPLIKPAHQKLCPGKFAINILCTVIGFISSLLHLKSGSPFPTLRYDIYSSAAGGCVISYAGGGKILHV